MATTFNFKDKYLTYSDFDPESKGAVSFLRFVSPFGKGNGSRENPSSSAASGYGKYDAVDACNILSNGVHKDLNISHTWGGRTFTIGQDKRNTLIDAVSSNIGGSIPSFYYTDCTILDIRAINGSLDFYYKNCILKNKARPVGGTINRNYAVQCLSYVSGLNDQGRNSYLNVETSITMGNSNLYDKCNINLTAAIITNTTYTDLYIAFNDCNFRIGNELEYLPLNGNTEAELRADFVARCTAQSINCRKESEYEVTNLEMSRWVFAKNSADDGAVLPNSIITEFENRRLVIFGYEASRDFILISGSKRNSNFNSSNPNSNFIIKDNSLSLPANIDITDINQAYITSNIIAFGGKKKLTKLDIIHNFPVEYGLSISDKNIIDFTPVTNIKADEYYIVRSNDKAYASVVYGGVTYTTDLPSKNFVFKGVDGITKLTSSTSNAVIYRIQDITQHKYMEVRIVNKIPEGKIKSGNLSGNYWYLVEHVTDKNNTTDYITYKGVKYYAGDSFLVDPASLTFTPSPNIYLRRCWNEYYNNPTDEIIAEDKAFWANEQKPKWCKIVIGDEPRCLMKGNTQLENEMLRDNYAISENFEYITNGHPQFYSGVKGRANFAVPSFNLTGAYMQLRIKLTTLNPM